MVLKRLHIFLFSLLLVCPIFAQEQWYFYVDERYPAERKQLSDKQRILLVNNAVIQPQAFGHTTVIDGESKGGVEVDIGLGHGGINHYLVVLRGEEGLLPLEVALGINGLAIEVVSVTYGDTLGCVAGCPAQHDLKGL